MRYRFGVTPWVTSGDTMQFMFAVNRLAEESGKPVFDAPVGDVGDRPWAGRRRYVEEYPEAWVVGPTASSSDEWLVIPRTKRAEDLMARAYAQET